MHENKIKSLLLSIIDSKIRGMNDCFLSLTGLQHGLALLQVRHCQCAKLERYATARANSSFKWGKG